VVASQNQEFARSDIMRGGADAQNIQVTLDGVNELDLCVTDGADGPACDHADWAEAHVTTKSGKKLWLDELPLVIADVERSPVPFSFTYDGQPSQELLKTWTRKTHDEPLGPDCQKEINAWDDPQSSLRVTCELIRYRDFPAVEWLVCCENIGKEDTKIVEGINACDLVLNSPLSSHPDYRLHRTKGGVPDPTHFEATTELIDTKHPRMLRAGSGRSSTADLPFFKIDAGRGSVIVAVGWSGCWDAKAACPVDRNLRLTAGIEQAHFLLHPGEKVRMPRMLALFWEGDSWEANARFRELIYQHYAARRSNQQLLPMLFCNTCFTRGGGWLNECNAENQISLINAYAPLGLEALLTDAGWFRGGWPSGAGNWTPREDAYPQGMGPVAAAAKAQNMIYGLWYEPERVVANTDLHKQHPDWLLRRQDDEDDTFLLNFGLPEVQEYFFNIVAGFMQLPGFRFYRQDFNMDPLPYWRYSDAPDRQGISEMKYIAGLYAYWDRIAATWPDSVREECASGGHRIDLETVMRMHLHQKTDYWFDDETDQNSLWGVSQYLPNNTIVAHLNRLDDYSFHSTLASSLCLGWIADGPDFDAPRAKYLADRYRAVRHLLIGTWYPLLPYARDTHAWTGSQFHRADLDEGLLLVFRRADSPYPTADVALCGLDSDGRYEVTSDRSGRLGVMSGAELAKSLSINLPERHSSDLIVYKRQR
jgi:alpha-galactosidase